MKKKEEEEEEEEEEGNEGVEAKAKALSTYLVDCCLLILDI